MTDSNNRTSLLVSSQLPAFVREEHDQFVKFLEYYYKFLEQDGQQLYVAKNFTKYLNIDLIYADVIHDDAAGEAHKLREEGDYHNFLQKMYDTYIKYIPDSVLTDKATLVKHAKEFYTSTGSEKSIRFLIRALLNKDAEFYYPKNDILRASDGKWFIERSLKITDISVDNVSNSIAVYNFANTTIRGEVSNASAIVEKVDTYYDKGQIIYELKLSSVYKEFLNDERIISYFTEEGIDKYLAANTFSGVIINAQLTYGGSGYIEGTSVPVVNTTGTGAEIIISKVSKGSIQAIGVTESGAGFKVNDFLVISGSGSGANAYVSEVDKSGFYHPNSYNVMWSTIGLEASTNIGNLIYSNLNSKIIDPANDTAGFSNSMSYFVYDNCGPARSFVVTDGGQNYVPPISLGISANSIISKMGILGKMKIVSGGTGYVIGDMIEFTNTYGSAGAGAIANVTNVAANGMITEVKFQQMPGQIIGGSGYDPNYLPAANVVSGTGTGANVAVTAVIGYNEQLNQSVSQIGVIQELTLISGGIGYLDNPTLALDQFGDGKARAILTSVSGVFSYPGRFITDDGHISGYNFLENRDYYQEFSYVVRVDETINKYRNAVRELIHPAGTRMFGEYSLVYDEETATNTNISVTYANTISVTEPYKTHYQVQDYTPGVFAPEIVTGQADAEFVAGSFSMNTSNHISTYAAQNNTIIIYYPSHSFLANDHVFLAFFGSNTWANLGNTNYTVTSSNVDYLIAYNPQTDANGNTGTVVVYKPDVMVAIPYSRPSVGDNVYLQFQTVDPSLANGIYRVTGTMGVNTFNVLHPDMTSANDPDGVANLISKKAIVSCVDHGFNVGDSAYIVFPIGTGDDANTVDGYYTVNEVGSVNSFNIAVPNIIFSVSTTRTFLKRSKIIIPNHPYANGTNVYIAYVSGDQGNTVNGVYQPTKIGANEMLLNVSIPATSNSNVRVWYQTNNYSNIVFTTIKGTNGFTATQNVDIEFFSSATDLANGIYMIRDVYNANSYNIYYNANTYIQNAWSTYHSNVYIPGIANNTYNVTAYSGLGIVANSIMEGTASVSVYK